MADNAEDIGSVAVSITGDYSALQASFNQAQTAAQQAGEGIAAALNTGVAGADALDSAVRAAAAGGATLADAMLTAATNIGDAGDAAAAAAGGVDALTGAVDTADMAFGGASSGAQSFSGAVASVDAEAKDAEGGLGGMAEKLTALGEALVITEGLKEFGTEALDAADNVTRASISLTAMTGSAGDAEKTISGLEELGMQDGLSFPNLLTAGTRMTQFLGAGANVPMLLGDIANGAAVMGTGIDQAANSFDRIASSGTVAARQLMQLGLTMPGLASAMNAVTGTTDATTASVSQMFKAMDETQRIDVLTKALSNLSGVAQQVAEQTFGGQWQQLVNAWDQVMVEAGQAILPVVSNLTDLLKVDIIPFLKGVADGFNALPGPVKDLVGGLALVAAASVPVIGALGAIGLAITGAKTAFETFGIGATEAAVKVETFAAEEGEATIANTAFSGSLAMGWTGFTSGANEAAVAVEEVGSKTTLTSLAMTELGGGIVASIALYGSLAYEILKAANAYNALHDAQNGAADSQKKLDDAISTLEIVMQRQGIDITALSAAYHSGVTSQDDYLRSLQTLEVEYANLHGGQQQASEDNRALQTAIGASVDAYNKLQTAVKTAQQVYDAMVASFNSGEPVYGKTVASAGMVADAHTKLEAALKAAQTAAGGVQAAIDPLDAAYHKIMTSGEGFASSEQLAADQAQAFADKSILLNDAVIGTGVKMDLAALKVADLKNQEDMGLVTHDAVIAAMQNEEKWADAYAAATARLAASQPAVTKTVKDFADQLSQAQVAYQAMVDGLAAGVTTQAQVQKAWQELQVAQQQYGIAVTGVISQQDLLSQALVDANAKLAAAQAGYDGSAKSVKALETAEKEALTAQEAFDTSQAEAAANTGDLTDKVNLAGIALAGAKAKLEDVTAAYGNGTATLQQLISATTAETSAQNAYNAAVGAAAGPMGNLIVTQQQVQQQQQALAQSLQDYVQDVEAFPAQAGPFVGTLQQIAEMALTGTTNMDGLATAVDELGFALTQAAQDAQSVTSGLNDIKISTGTSSVMPGELGFNLNNPAQLEQAMTGTSPLVDFAAAYQAGATAGSYNASTLQMLYAQKQITAGSYSVPGGGTVSIGQGSTSSGAGAAPTTTSSVSMESAATSPSSIISSGGTAMIDEVNNGALYGQLQEMIQLLGGPANFVSTITSTVDSISAATTQASQATTAASASIVAAVSSSATQIAEVVTGFTGAVASVAAIASAVAASKNVTTGPVALGGTVATTPAAGTGTVGGVGSGSFANTGGIQYFQNGAPITLNFANARFGGSVNEVTAAVQNALVNGLRTAGARF